MSKALPQRYGKYVLLRRVAVGGMAEIFKAKVASPEGFEKELVIKRILPHLNEDEEFVRMFVDEARITAKLQHANIVQIFDFDVVDGTYYIAMEYIEGKDLKDVIDRSLALKIPLSVYQAVWIAIEVAKGLHYAHTKEERGVPLNIVHRDVTPSNIMLSYRGDVKLMDFGIAKAAQRTTKTQAGAVKGKVAYMSPEQARGRAIDGRTDVFALGVLLWETLTERRLFVAESDFDTLTNVLKMEAPAPSSINPAVPLDLDPLIAKCLAKDPDKRFASADVLVSELTRWFYSNVVDLEKEKLKPLMFRLFKEEIDELEELSDEERELLSGIPRGSPASVTSQAQSRTSTVSGHADSTLVHGNRDHEKTNLYDGHTQVGSEKTQIGGEKTQIGGEKTQIAGGHAPIDRSAVTGKHVRPSPTVGTVIVHAVDDAPPIAARPAGKKRTWLWIVLVLLLVGGGATAAILLMGGGPSSPGTSGTPGTGAAGASVGGHDQARDPTAAGTAGAHVDTGNIAADAQASADVARAETITLYVKVTPPEAKVKLDGTPIEGEKAGLAVGSTVHLVAEAADYKPFASDVVVREAGQIVTITMEKAGVPQTFVVEPSAATDEVWIGDKRLGLGPQSYEGILGQTIVIKVVPASGGAPILRALTIDNTTTVVKITTPAELLIALDPPVAATVTASAGQVEVKNPGLIRVSGVDIGLAIDLDISAPGFKPLKRSVTLSRPTETLALALEKIPANPVPGGGGKGTLQVSARPWAQVSVNGRPYGTTPQTIRDLPAGTYTVVFTKGALIATKRVTVVGGKQVQVAADLTE